MAKDEIILVVDDDPDHLSLIEHYVAHCGLQCESVEGGVAAIEYLKSTNISLLVTDMAMPEMNGMELLKYTKEHHSDVDVIVMTGYSAEYSYIDVIRAGAADFIAKPFKKEEFAAKLDRVFMERNLLKELQVSKEKAEVASRAKTAFLNTIGHELMTPMNGILGFSELLKQTDLPVKQREYVEMVEHSATRLLRLINQILDFAQIDAGENDIKPCHFHLDSVFEKIFVSAQPRAAKKGLALDLEIDKSLSKKILFGDQLILTQSLNNLLDNAIKFTDSGSIVIKVITEEVPIEDTINLQFSIKDSGCGIEAKKQGEIFHPFTQSEEYMTRRHEGAGLGLAICAKLVNMMNGQIWLESEVNQGSTFYFTAQMAAA